ncbi:OLC1v1015444C1 [Oldenlandia corymbosa var. corymbosa]|uniref:OLC1v1015444C1 n=1 Tax=Oldenlandia corymbosa var. corymbosa TaxID=529605 RepID=A0AAV1E3H5_OLDCO|nr:OLC1v1015444C1 [Oldenlandia corymbosa var. corymbosa]
MPGIDKLLLCFNLLKSIDLDFNQSSNYNGLAVWARGVEVPTAFLARWPPGTLQSLKDFLDGREGGISFSTQEDAAKTSIFSKSWPDLWLDVDRLDFESRKMWKAIEDDEHPDYERFLESNCQKRVHMLELDLSAYDGMVAYICYDFSLNLLGLTNGNSFALPLPNSYGHGINSDALSFGCNSLRTLAFKGVNVSREVLEFFLHNCPFLEHLGVEISDDLENFKVTTWFKNVPMLVDVFIGGLVYGMLGLFDRVISWLACCLSRLEALTVDIKTFGLIKGKNTNVVFPQLKQLSFQVSEPSNRSLISYTYLMRAFPNLEKFILKAVGNFNVKTRGLIGVLVPGVEVEAEVPQASVFKFTKTNELILPWGFAMKMRNSKLSGIVFEGGIRGRASHRKECEG